MANQDPIGLSACHMTIGLNKKTSNQPMSLPANEFNAISYNSQDDLGKSKVNVLVHISRNILQWYEFSTNYYNVDRSAIQKD